MNDILEQLQIKGKMNPTSNRHRVANLMAKFELSHTERNLVFQHFGHSKDVNENVYQACPGSMQLKVTGNLLQQIKDNKKGM